MTHHSMSAGARQALGDLLSSTTEMTDLLDTETGPWTLADATSAAVELEANGYGYRNVNGTFQWAVPLLPFTGAQLTYNSPTPEEPCS